MRPSACTGRKLKKVRHALETHQVQLPEKNDQSARSEA